MRKYALPAAILCLLLLSVYNVIGKTTQPPMSPEREARLQALYQSIKQTRDYQEKRHISYFLAYDRQMLLGTLRLATKEIETIKKSPARHLLEAQYMLSMIKVGTRRWYENTMADSTGNPLPRHYPYPKPLHSKSQPKGAQTICTIPKVPCRVEPIPAKVRASQPWAKMGIKLPLKSRVQYCYRVAGIKQKSTFTATASTRHTCSGKADFVRIRGKVNEHTGEVDITYFEYAPQSKWKQTKPATARSAQHMIELSTVLMRAVGPAERLLKQPQSQDTKQLLSKLAPLVNFAIKYRAVSKLVIPHPVLPSRTLRKLKRLFPRTFGIPQGRGQRGLHRRGGKW